MNKSDVVEALSNKLKMKKKEANAVVEAIFGQNGGIITTALNRRDQVSLSGFGVFELKRRAARTARNPKTGKSVLVPEKFIPAFRPSKALKEKLGSPTRRGKTAKSK